MIDVASLLSGATNNPIEVGALTNIDNALIVPSVIGDLPRHRMLAAFTGAAASVLFRGALLWTLAKHIPAAGLLSCAGPGIILIGAAILLVKAFREGKEQKSHNSFWEAAGRVAWIDTVLGVDSVIAAYSTTQNFGPLAWSTVAGFSMLMLGTVITVGLQSAAKYLGVEDHRVTRALSHNISSAVNTGAYAYMGYLGGVMAAKGAAGLMAKFGAAGAAITGKGIAAALVAMSPYVLAAAPWVGGCVVAAMLVHHFWKRDRQPQRAADDSISQRRHEEKPAI